MTLSDKPQFAALLVNIWSSAYGKKIDTATLDLFWIMLGTVQYKAFEEALYNHVKDPERGRFVPKVADLFYQLLSAFDPLLAWTKVAQAVKCYGAYPSIVFDDPCIHTVITDMNGWVKLCSQPESTLPFYQREFERRYQHARRYPPELYPRELIGLVNHQNQQHGYPLQQPCFFGDANHALEVYKYGVEPAQILQRLTSILSLKKLEKNSETFESKQIEISSKVNN